MPNSIGSDDLKIAIARVLAHVDFYGVKEIDASEFDNYWHVCDSDCFDFSKEPEISVGSLDDDIGALRALADGGEATVVDIQRLAHILMFIAFRLIPPRQKVSN
jgi:hypothetical protein